MFKKKKSSVNPNYGSCCKDLFDSMNEPAKSFFNVDEEGVLFLTVGYVQTDEGTGWFDHAVLHCPFCGASLQTKQ